MCCSYAGEIADALHVKGSDVKPRLLKMLMQGAHRLVRAKLKSRTDNKFSIYGLAEWHSRELPPGFEWVAEKYELLSGK